MPRTLRAAFLLLGTWALLGLAAATAALTAPGNPESPVLSWLPRPASPGRISPPPELYYEGPSGSVIGAAPRALPAVSAAGGVTLDLAPGEALFAFLVEDAERAAFAAGARVLLRSGHEVLVATTGEVPQLTLESDRTLTGVKQPVRIDTAPRPSSARRSDQADLPPPAEGVDPLVREMVREVSAATYVPIWQSLDDFETREVSQPNNLAASQWMLETLQSYWLSAAFHYYQQNGEKRNVIATLPGSVDPTKVVYICGHFDTITSTPAACAPGADDNGSGTAAVLETARVLSQYSFAYTIKFACFNGEEQGMCGSTAYVAEMAAAGEKIIAVYNCDMIGFRGTDPAPADLVIYANTASQSVAAVLANAATTYVPGQIEPVVVVQPLAVSDHASFWNHNYSAVCSIEDEVWGNDFSPWYHTCDDRIEQYPRDYAVSCARANLAAVALTARPLTPPSSFLVLESSQLDDDAVGGSSGNGDGIANPGETVELWTTVHNAGGRASTGVTGTITTTTPGITILDAAAAFNDIPSGGQGENVTAFRFQLASSVSDGTALTFTLHMTDSQGARLLPLDYTAAAPMLTHYWHQVRDEDAGNGNGVIDPGEEVLVPVTLRNGGGQGAVEITAQATSGSAHLTVLNGTATAASIPGGDVSELTPGFRFAVSPQATPGEVLRVSVAISAAGGYATSASFSLKVGTAVYDECEADGPWSLASPGDDATNGRWVRGDPIGTTVNGQPCQPEDDHTAAPGVDCYFTGQGPAGGTADVEDVSGGRTTLTTPLLDLPRLTGARITYWRWFTNNLGSSPSLDPWVVQISGDDGATWVDLETTIQSANHWRQESFLVSDYLAPTSRMRVRFIAVDIAPNSLVEAAVDDFEVSGESASAGAGDIAAATALRLDPPRPNPARAGTRLRFALPQAGPVSLQIFAIDGRLVRTLVRGTLPAGEREAIWDGRNNTGRAAAPGLYFCRLSAGARVLSQRLVLAPSGRDGL
jgi:hypothetical protein